MTDTTIIEEAAAQSVSDPGDRLIRLSDGDMDAIRRLEKAGFGGHELPRNPTVTLNRTLNTKQQQKAEQFNRYVESLRYILSSNDPRYATMIKEAQEECFLTQQEVADRRKSTLTPTDVHVRAVIPSLSRQYVNEELIGDMLMPPVLVPNKNGTYFTYTQRDLFSAPDDAIGTDGEVNEISKSRSTANFTCRDRGLGDHIGADVIANQDAPLNEMVDLMLDLNDLIAFKREQRIATVLTTSGNYGANTAAVAAANRWDTAGGGNPIADLQTGFAALWRGRGGTRIKLFSSLEVYHVLSRHPDILGLFQYNGSSPGLATPDMIARFLTADEYLVGAARQDTANESVTASYSRIWAPSSTYSMGILRVADAPTIRSAHFGSTFRWNRMGSDQGIGTLQWFDPTKGLDGAFFGKVTVAETHDVVAALAGYLITTPIG